MNKKELLTHYPLVSNYPQHAYYFSIISNDENCLPWIYSNYLNMCLMGTDKDCYLDYYAQSPEHHYHPCFTDTQRLLRSTILKYMPNIVDFIKEQIQQDNYIWLHVNEYYLPGSLAYQRYTCPHAIFIYGFDDFEKHFKVGGFFKNSKYNFTYVSYTDIEKSFYDFGNTHIDSDVTQHVNYMHLLKLHPNHHQGLPYQFDMKFVAEQIKDYYESKNLSLNYQSFYSHESYSEWTYGIDILPKLIEYYSLNLESSTKLDSRPLYTLFDYKKLMVARIKYIEKNKLYDFNPMFLEGFIKLKNKSENLLNLYLKYTLTKNKDNCHRLVVIFDELYLNEQVLLEQLLNDFSKNSLL